MTKTAWASFLWAGQDIDVERRCGKDEAIWRANVYQAHID